jgi:hypothetical protein
MPICLAISAIVSPFIYIISVSIARNIKKFQYRNNYYTNAKWLLKKNVKKSSKNGTLYLT